MFLNQIPAPPIDMVMPPINGIVAVANFVVLAIVLLFVVREALRTRSAVPLLIVVGCTLTCVSEPIYDFVGSVWYPHYGTTALVRDFNVSIPLWMIPAYGWYMGGLGNLMYRKIGNGISVRHLWMFYFLFWVANLCMEVPALNLGVYKYYGDQPFRIFGFPLWMAMTNSLMPILIGTVCNVLRDVLVGPRAFFTVILMPMLIGMPQIAAGWPTWMALNGGVGLVGTHLAALVTFGFSISIVYLLSTKICVRTQF